MNRLALLAAVAAASLCASARTFELTAWRGETVASVVPDFVEFGEVPEGIGIRFGILRPVKYAPVPNSVQRLECMDRVEWERPRSWCSRIFGWMLPGSGDNVRVGCQRVVEVSVPAGAKSGVYKCGAMDVRVIDRVLPPAKDWKYFLDLWQHPWAVARYFGVKPFSRAHYAAMKPVYETLATAG